MFCVPGNKTVRICRPQCTLGCVNGECIEVDTCNCKEGYEFANDSEHICQPVCNPSCGKGKCIGPNECKCDEGIHNT